MASFAPESTPGVQERHHENRLVRETSPYLLQHAHNPVEWYPWGEEAFQAAREQDKPIFLSVGYSTCYWCHVMERESFESEDVARIMNEHFINIKVDREERPDVDDIYMTAVQLLTGSGGWPMSVFMEPQTLKPFFGGTYFPAQPSAGMISFPDLLRRIDEAWKNRRGDVVEYAQQVADRVTQALAEQHAAMTMSHADVDRAVGGLLASYDAEDGGFTGPRRAPKFPTPSNLDLLMQAAWENPQAKRAVTHTLDRMAMGGMYDQVGGGFHRYSTDAKWLVPHFEKMLYNNGQLASTYAHAFELTQDPYYAQVLREVLRYVQREMTGEHGGFFSAQDAEVNAREGQNYLWRKEQIRSSLAEAGLEGHVEFALDIYGVSKGRNFQDPHHPEDGSFNVLFLPERPEVLAERYDISLDDYHQRVAAIDAALLEVRDQQDQPLTDDKILAGWNGLMIAGMADGGRVLNEEAFIDAARRAAVFVLDTMRTDDGRLLRTYREGVTRIDGLLVDYAFTIHGLLALHEATGKSRWLATARELAAIAHQLFYDEQGGGYFDTLADQSDLFVRTKSTYGGAVPSGMSVMANNLLSLHELTGERAYLDQAVDALRAMSWRVASNPTGATVAVHALDRYLDQHDELALRGEPIPVPITSEIVTLSVMEDRSVLADGVLARLDLVLTMKPPWHINAHEPGDDSLIGLSVQLVGVEGAELHVSYPPGEPFHGPVDSMKVYRGDVTIPIVIRQTDAALSGQPQLVIEWQACDDQKCLAPERQVLTIQLGQ